MKTRNPVTVDRFFLPYEGTNLPSGVGGMSIPDYYYFFGFNNVFLQYSSLLEQTIGWEGGVLLEVRRLKGFGNDFLTQASPGARRNENSFAPV